MKDGHFVQFPNAFGKKKASHHIVKEYSHMWSATTPLVFRSLERAILEKHQQRLIGNAKDGIVAIQLSLELVILLHICEVLLVEVTLFVYFPLNIIQSLQIVWV